MFFTRGKRYLAVWGFLVLLLSFALFGCGANNKKGNTTTNSNTGASSYDFVPVKEAGYYADLRVMPNGEFLVRGKFKDEEADKSGLVYKVEMNDSKQVNQITSIYKGKPINSEWRDTLNDTYIFAAVTIEYQEDYKKYVFQGEDMSICRGLYGANWIRYKYDEKRKNYIIAYLYDNKEEQQGGRYSQIWIEYGDRGQIAKLSYFNKNGERVSNNNKHYETRLKYDESKASVFPIEVANYGQDGSLIPDNYGIAKTVYVYDVKSRLTEVRYFGPDESLGFKKYRGTGDLWDFTSISYTYGAITKYVYADDGIMPVKKLFLGKEGQPMAVNGNYPCAAIVYTYTNEGRIASKSLLGTDDMPCTGKWSEASKIVYGYDDNGNLESVSFYGKDNNRVTTDKTRPVSIIKYKYDDNHRKIETSYFGTDGNPVM